jgi:multidrug efflux pump
MKITEKSIDQPLISSLIGGLLFFFGLAAYLVIPTEAVPEIKVPVAGVFSQYIGAGPEEIESEIIKPLEESLKELDNLDYTASYALQGFAYTVVAFTPEADIESSLRDLREKVSDAEANFIDEVESAKITQMNFDDIPILILNIFGNYPMDQITTISEDVMDEIDAISGVNEVTIFGNIGREIKISVNPNLLKLHKIPVQSIIKSLQENNLNMPGGSVEINGQELLVRTVGKFNSIESISNLTIFQFPDESIVRLKDVATIKDTYEEQTSYSRYNQQNSITLLVRKKVGYNIVETSLEIEKLVEKLSDEFPTGLEYKFSSRLAEETERSTSQLSQNAIFGALLVIITLYFGIGFRNALIVTFAIPFSLLTAYLLQFAFGISQSGITMFALIMVLGIVVDGAIIVSEATFRQMELGLNRKDASKKAIQKVGSPIITSILTTMAAFAPMMFMTGIMGQFMSYIPKIVIFSLIGATIADHLIIPILASQFMVLNKKNSLMAGDWIGSRIYVSMINWALHNRKLTLFITFSSFIIGVLILGISASTNLNLVKVQVFPNVPMPRFVIDIETEPGTDLEYTNSIALNLENILANTPEVSQFAVTVGQSGVQNMRLNQGSAIGSEIAQINVDLIDKADREKSVDEIILELQEKVENIPGVEFQFSVIKEGPPVEDKLVIDIQGEDLNHIRIVSEKIKHIFENTEGIYNIASSLGKTRKEIQINVNHDKSAILGVSSQSISQTISSALFGFEAITYSDGSDEIPVKVEIDKSESRILSDIRSLEVPTNKNTLELLSNVADVDFTTGQASIFRKNFKRTVSVSADIYEQYSLMDIKRIVKQQIDQLIVPKGIATGFGGINDETAESFKTLGRSMIIAFLIILILLAAQFKSLKQPFIIGITIPLSFIGVILGLMITRVPFGMMSFFGIVALTGIVVNDAIVMISQINDYRSEGKGLFLSLVEGGKTRLRPILLTTITTIAGLIPLTLDFAGGAEYWRPLAVSLIFGLLVATILTLVVVPVLYSFIEKMDKDQLKNI